MEEHYVIIRHEDANIYAKPCKDCDQWDTELGNIMLRSYNIDSINNCIYYLSLKNPTYNAHILSNIKQ